MISRRRLLMSVASGMLLPGVVMASVGMREQLSWADFQKQMVKLAKEKQDSTLTQDEIASSGIRYLKKLDIHSTEFKRAVAESYESGNQYWLWQRLMKQHNINGGILNIDSEKMVQLHDHPGATGMVRIISGEAEVWQFDEIHHHGAGKNQDEVELVRTARKVLRPGDTANLTPGKGNIHALKSITEECRMLDFFIPPYEISKRSWFEPMVDDWFDMKKLSCRKIPHTIYNEA